MHETSRICTKCGIEKPLTDYFRHKRGRAGHFSYCKVCATAQIRASEMVNPIRRWACVGTCSARDRAKKRGVPFDLTAAYMRSLHVTHCPALGIELNYAPKGWGPTDASPSIDRLRPELGYVPGNVVVLSNRANRIKADASPEELRKIADWLEKQLHLSTNEGITNDRLPRRSRRTPADPGVGKRRPRKTETSH